MLTSFRSVDCFVTMVKLESKKKAPAKKDRPNKRTRQQYPLEMKYLARAWRTKDNMSAKDIIAKLKADYNVDIPPPTLSTWYNPKNMDKFSNVATDRVKVQDVCYNPRQMPDVLVDMEQILSRKYNAVATTGVPYSQDVTRLLAIHIFHKLVACNIYNPRGQRKEQH